MGLTLNLADHSVTGIYMENLISLWCARGLTYEQAQVLLGASYSVQRLDYLFAKCLDKDKDAFETVRCRIMMTLDFWEEIPAWDEVWRLKRAFDKLEADLHPTIKLYTIIICEILPDMVAKVSDYQNFTSGVVNKRRSVTSSRNRLLRGKHSMIPQSGIRHNFRATGRGKLRESNLMNSYSGPKLSGNASYMISATSPIRVSQLLIIFTLRVGGWPCGTPKLTQFSLFMSENK